MFLLDFLVQAEDEKYRCEEHRGHHETHQNGRGGVEVGVGLRGPYKRHAPKDHGQNARHMYDVGPAFHAAKVQFFKIVFPNRSISARFL